MKVILASASPRRKELLAKLTADFTVMVSDCEEQITKDIPSDVVMELAAQKAQAVAAAYGKKTAPVLFIGADTVVVHRGEILGKPKDAADARRMLQSLSGDTHQVYTGVCLLFYHGLDDCDGQLNCFYEKTDVTFYPMSDQEIDDYIATKDPLDKAGAYGIQGICGKFISGIHGDYNNVVGLPLARLYHELLSFIGDV